jgi:hypothetical protein
MGSPATGDAGVQEAAHPKRALLFHLVLTLGWLRSGAEKKEKTDEAEISMHVSSFPQVLSLRIVFT